MTISTVCKVRFTKEVLTDYWASSSFGYGSAMKENLAGIEDYTRIGSTQPEQIVKYGELTLRENQIAYAEPSFFRLLISNFERR